MRLNSYLLYFLFLYNTITAQHDIALPGIVVEQNSKYKTGKVVFLPNVSIRSMPPSAPQRSDANGKFSLLFSDYRGGSAVKIYAAKEGFEVANQKELENAAILGRYEPLKIVMCKAGELAENQVKYYNIGVEAITESYEKKIALLNKESEEKEALIQELRERHRVLLTEKASILYYLEKDKEEALAQMRSFSERFAEVNLDDADSLYIAAYNAFIEKRIEDVYKILDLQILEKNIEAAKKLIAQGHELIAYADSVKVYNLHMLEQFIKGGWLAANAAVKNQALEKAQDYYKQALNAESCNIESRILYAQFLAEYMQDAVAYLDNLEKTITCLEQSEKKQDRQNSALLILKLHSQVNLFFQNPTSIALLIKRLEKLL